MNLLKTLFNNKKVIKYITISFMSIILCLVLFLTVNLFVFYNKNIKKSDDGTILYYNFKPHTIAYYQKYPDYSDVDISEKFLSYGISYGIDVSEWQGNINWEKVKNTGISFAMIRCGYREIVGNNFYEDAKFRKNIEEATRVGLQVGVYFYGTARNEKEALEEAEFTVNLIKDYNITYPVVYDAEVFNRGRLVNVSNSTITDNILTFTETVASYGYETMVYSYYDALTNILDTGKFDGKLIWLSHFSETTGYTGNYNMWQYTEEGRVDGISTNVDLNISYFQYVDNEEDIVPNPRYKNIKDDDMMACLDEVKTVKNSVLRSTPTSSLPNRFGRVNRGTVLKRTGYNDDFSRIDYNGRIVYISNDNIELNNG